MSSNFIQIPSLDYAVIIGRFNPPHKGHEEILRTAMSISPNVIVLLGSSKQARSSKNPFSWQEREAMILAMAKDINPEYKNVIVKPIVDYKYDDNVWIRRVQEAVKSATGVDGSTTMPSFSEEAKVGLVGHVKDKSSYYLKLFPQWDMIELPLMHEGISSTKIREWYFEDTNESWAQVLEHTPGSVSTLLSIFAATENFKWIKDEKEFMDKYMAKFSKVPYPVTFLTTDAVVTCKGHVLLVKRKHTPGKGLWALPGGHLNIDETPLNNSVKELYEETNIKLPPGAVYNSLKEEKVFADPDRSLRKRTVTIGHHFQLSTQHLPQVEAADDAAAVQWIPISDIDQFQDQLFEDHYSIIQYFLNRS